MLGKNVLSVRTAFKSDGYVFIANLFFPDLNLYSILLFYIVILYILNGMLKIVSAHRCLKKTERTGWKKKKPEAGRSGLQTLFHMGNLNLLNREMCIFFSGLFSYQYTLKAVIRRSNDLQETLCNKYLMDSSYKEVFIY